jgi:hypothetical protein
MSSASSPSLSNDITSSESLSKISCYLVLKICKVLVHQCKKFRWLSCGLHPLHTPNHQQQKHHFLTSIIILVGWCLLTLLVIYSSSCEETFTSSCQISIRILMLAGVFRISRWRPCYTSPHTLQPTRTQ